MANLSLTLLDAVGGMVSNNLLDDRCNMEFFLDVQLMVDDGWVLIELSR